MAIEDAKKLYIYQQTLLHLGGRSLTSLTENHERRHRLDQGWGDGSELVKAGLARASWNHGMRSVRLEYDPAIEPSFGPRYAFEKPTDLERLEGLSYSEDFITPLTNRDYTAETGYWYANATPLYAKFVSSRTDYGFDSSRWPVTFQDLLAAMLAQKCCYATTGSMKKMQELYAKEKDVLARARGVDALEEGMKMQTPSRWVRARGQGSRAQDRYVEQ